MPPVPVRLEIFPETPEWFPLGKCRDYDTKYMFPGDSPRIDKGTFVDKTEKAVANEICHGGDGKGVCPVMKECEIYADTTRSRWGVWGGKTSHERQQSRPRMYITRSQQCLVP